VIKMAGKHLYCLAPLAALSLICLINGPLSTNSGENSRVKELNPIFVPVQKVDDPSNTLCGVGQLVTSLDNVLSRKTYMFTNSTETGTTKLMSTTTTDYGRSPIDTTITAGGLLVEADGYDNFELRNLTTASDGSYKRCGLQGRHSNDYLLSCDSDGNLSNVAPVSSSTSSSSTSSITLTNAERWYISFTDTNSVEVENYDYEDYYLDYSDTYGFSGFSSTRTGSIYMWRELTFTTGSTAWAGIMSAAFANVCSATSTSVTPSDAILSAWKAQAAEYNAYPTSFKSYLSTYTVTDESDPISAAILKYQFIINKYGVDAFANYGGNFLNRSVASSSQSGLKASSILENEGALVVTAVSATIALAGFLLLKKRRIAHGA
jgi:hypothetical protein